MRRGEYYVQDDDNNGDIPISEIKQLVRTLGYSNYDLYNDHETNEGFHYVINEEENAECEYYMTNDYKCVFSIHNQLPILFDNLWPTSHDTYMSPQLTTPYGEPRSLSFQCNFMLSNIPLECYCESVKDPANPTPSSPDPDAEPQKNFASFIDILSIKPNGSNSNGFNVFISNDGYICFKRQYNVNLVSASSTKKYKIDKTSFFVGIATTFEFNRVFHGDSIYDVHIVITYGEVGGDQIEVFAEKYTIYEDNYFYDGTIHVGGTPNVSSINADYFNKQTIGYGWFCGGCPTDVYEELMGLEPYKHEQ